MTPLQNKRTVTTPLMAALVFAGALFLAAVNTPTHAQDVDCTSPQTQMAMNICSSRDAETADAVLNEIWSTLRAKTRAFDADANIPEGERISDQLLTAQRAWIQYRDGQCNAEGAQYYGGSIRPLIVNTCVTRMTEARTQELRTMLQEN